MSALLALLGLFVLATLAARPGAWTLVVDRAATPLWVGAGFAAASPFFGAVPRWLIADVSPVVVVATAFVALLAGGTDARGGRAIVGAFAWLGVLVVVVAAAFALAAPLVASLGDVPALTSTSTTASARVWGGALFVGAGLVSSVLSAEQTTGAVASVVGILGALVVGALGADPHAGAAPLVLVVGLAGAGVAVAGVTGLVAGDDGQRIVVVAGAVTLASGACALLHQPVAVVAVVAGLALRQTARTHALLVPLARLRRPLFFVLAFFVGASLAVGDAIDAATAATGVVVAVVVVVVRAVAARVVGASLGALSAGLSTSPLALALWVNVASSGAAPLPLGSLCAVAVVAVVVVDCAAALLTLFVRDRAVVDRG